MLGKHIVVFVLGDIRPQLDITLGTAVALAPVVFENALAHRFVGRFLIGLANGGVHAKAARIHLFRVVLGECLADHLGDVLGMNGVFAHFSSRAQRSFESLVVLHCSNVAELGHAPKHVLLALLGALRVGDRVVERRCFGQTGEHGDLAEAQLV